MSDAAAMYDFVTGDVSMDEIIAESETVGEQQDALCGQCGVLCESKEVLRRHVEETHEPVKLFACADCEKAFSNKNALQRHLNTYHKTYDAEGGGEPGDPMQDGAEGDVDLSTIKHYTCQMCERKFTQKQNLDRHIDAVHRNVRNFTCELCESAFSQRGNLKRHIDNLHKRIEYNCPECQRPFSQKENLERHINTVHRSIKNFRCNFCQNNFTQKGNLLRHIANMHDNARSLQAKKSMRKRRIPPTPIDADSKAKPIKYTLVRVHFKDKIIVQPWNAKEKSE